MLTTKINLIALTSNKKEDIILKCYNIITKILKLSEFENILILQNQTQKSLLINQCQNINQISLNNFIIIETYEELNNIITNQKNIVVILSTIKYNIHKIKLICKNVGKTIYIEEKNVDILNQNIDILYQLLKKIIQYEIYRDDTFIEWGEVIYSKYLEERDKESDKRYIEAKKKYTLKIDELYKYKDWEKINKGFPFELIKTETKFHSILKCIICNGIIRNPISCKDCSQMYCKKCTENIKKCPNCNNILKRRSIDENIKKILDLVEFNCPNKCGESLNIHNFENHILNCEKSLYICCIEGCEFIDTKEKIEAHIKDCALKTLLCKYCKENIEKINFKLHQEKCKIEKIFCKYCGVEKNREELCKHLNNDCKINLEICFYCMNYFKYKDYLEHNKNECLQNNFWRYNNIAKNETSKRILLEKEIEKLKEEIEYLKKSHNEEKKE